MVFKKKEDLVVVDNDEQLDAQVDGASTDDAAQADAQVDDVGAGDAALADGPVVANEGAERLAGEIAAIKTMIASHMVGSDARHMRERVATVATLSTELGKEVIEPIVAGLFAPRDR